MINLILIPIEACVFQKSSNIGGKKQSFSALCHHLLNLGFPPKRKFVFHWGEGWLPSIKHGSTDDTLSSQVCSWNASVTLCTLFFMVRVKILARNSADASTPVEKLSMWGRTAQWQGWRVQAFLDEQRGGKRAIYTAAWRVVTKITNANSSWY